MFYKIQNMGFTNPKFGFYKIKIQYVVSTKSKLWVLQNPTYCYLWPKGTIFDSFSCLKLIIFLQTITTKEF